MGKFTAALIIMICINLTAMIIVPDMVSYNPLSKMFNFDENNYPTTLNNDFSQKLPNATDPSGVLVGSGINFSFTDVIQMVWALIEFFIGLLLAPILLLISLDAPAVLVLMIGVPMVLIYILGIIELIRGTSI